MKTTIGNEGGTRLKHSRYSTKEGGNGREGGREGEGEREIE